MTLKKSNTGSTFADRWPERAAEQVAREKEYYASVRPSPSAIDEAAMMRAIHDRQVALSRCIRLMRAVEALGRARPEETAEWLEESFKTAPGYSS